MASRKKNLASPIGESSRFGVVFGETPKTAAETAALPNPTASFRLSAGMRWER